MVALKFLTEKLSQDNAMLTRFHGEVALAHRVTYPNICRLHDSDNPGGQAAFSFDGI